MMPSSPSIGIAAMDARGAMVNFSTVDGFGRSRQTGTGGVDHLCGKVVDELAVLLFLIHFPAP